MARPPVYVVPPPQLDVMILGVLMRCSRPPQTFAIVDTTSKDYTFRLPRNIRSLIPIHRVPTHSSLPASTTPIQQHLLLSQPSQ